MLLSGGLFDAGGGGLFGPGAGEDTFLDGDSPDDEDAYTHRTIGNRAYRYNKDYDPKRHFHPYNNSPCEYEDDSESDDSDDEKHKAKILRTKISLILVFTVCCCAFPLILYAPVIFYVPV